MWDGSGQRLPIPMETESDSSLLSQPPLQLEHGHVWPSVGQSVAPVSNSILGPGEAIGKRMEAFSTSGDSWKWWLQGQVPGTELAHVLAVGTAAIKSSSWCEKST